MLAKPSPPRPRWLSLLPLLALAVASVVGGCDDGEAGGDPPEGIQECSPRATGLPECMPRQGTVHSVVDGDTFYLEALCERDADCGSKSDCVGGHCDPLPKVRLIAADTPELSGPDYLAPEARVFTAGLLPKGTPVKLVYEPVGESCDDIHDRRLAYVWAEDTLVQERLVQRGMACIYWFSNRTQRRDMLCYDRLVAAEHAARDAELGIWGGVQPETCDNPD